MGHEREGGNAWAPIGAKARGKGGHRRCMIRTVAAWTVIRTMAGRRWLQRNPRRSLAVLDLAPLRKITPLRSWLRSELGPEGAPSASGLSVAPNLAVVVPTF